MNLETTFTFTDNKVLAALSPEDFALLGLQ
jgi:hypothetical protein